MSFNEISVTSLSKTIPNLLNNLLACQNEIDDLPASEKINAQAKKIPFLLETKKELSSYHYIIQGKLEILGTTPEIETVQDTLEQTELVCLNLLNTYKDAPYEALNSKFLAIINQLHIPKCDFTKIEIELQQLQNETRRLGKLDPEQQEKCISLEKDIIENLVLIAEKKAEESLTEQMQDLNNNNNNNNVPTVEPAPILSQLEELPDEILLKISHFLPRKALLSLCKMSQRMRAFVDGDRQWKSWQINSQQDYIRHKKITKSLRDGIYTSQTLKIPEMTGGFLVHTDKAYVVCGASIQVWDLKTGKQMTSFDSGSLYYMPQLAIYDNKLIVGSNKTIKIWNLDSLICEHTLEMSDTFKSLCICQDKLVCDSDNQAFLQIWDLKTLKNTNIPYAADKTSRAQSWQIYNDWLILGKKGFIEIFHLDSLKQIASFPLDGQNTFSLLVIGDKLLSGHHWEIKIWDLKTLKHLANLPLDISDVCFQIVYGDKLICGSDQNSKIEVRDLNTLKLVCFVESFIGFNNPKINNVQLFNDQLLFSSWPKMIQIRNLNVTLRETLTQIIHFYKSGDRLSAYSHDTRLSYDVTGEIFKHRRDLNEKMRAIFEASCTGEFVPRETELDEDLQNYLDYLEENKEG